MNKEEDWKKEVLERDEGYDINEFLSYRKLPISEKLKYLEEATELFNKITPRENKIAWEKLKEQGY